MEESTPRLELIDTLTADPPDGDGRVLAGRYRLGVLLGRGGFGRVFRARDAITGRDVAVKLLDPVDDDVRVRVGREAAALRLLSIPGVASLLDEGREDHDHFLVMELIEGLPFPGTPAVLPWAELAPLALSLLGTLHRIHQAGIVHRDLKPGNVLVSADGLAKVLDFGLARGSALGSTVTRTGAVIGTPRYLAPEQVCGERTDARSDLYAVGAMFYEALTGRPPHDADGLQVLLQQKLHLAPRPVRALAPDVPLHVADVVERMLATEPDRRPASAAAVLATLDQGRLGERHLLPRLGDSAVVDAVATALIEGRAVDLVGPVGSGRTRTLEEAAARVVAEGRRAVWLVPGERPFSSLAPALKPEELAEIGATNIAEAVAAQLRTRLQGGLVLIADDWPRLDRWSAQAVLASRGAGGVVRALLEEEDPQAALMLPRLDELALQPLFHGPDRLLHRAEDAARALAELSGGLPARVVAEVGAWVGGGIARWRDGRLEVLGSGPRRGPALAPATTHLSEASLEGPLDELLTWITLAAPHADVALLRAVSGASRWELEVELDELVRLGAVQVDAEGRVRALVAGRGLQHWSRDRRVEAHRRLAGLLPLGAEWRLEHVLAGGLQDQVADEALARVEALKRDGQLPEARATVERALIAMRAGSVAEREVELLTALGQVAMALQAQEPVDQALYELARCADPEAPEAVRIAALLDAWRDAVGTEAERGAAKAEAMAPFDDPALEGWRQAARMSYAFRCGAASASAVLEDMRPWAEGAGDHARARYTGWLGMVRHKQSRFDEAAAHQEVAAALAQDATTRLSVLVNAAMAHLEAFRHDTAQAWARQAQAEAQKLRLAFHEMHAEWLLRSVRYRRGEAMVPDLELVAAVDALGEVGQGAMLRLLEGGVAWRLGQRELAAELAGAARTALSGAGWTLQADLAEAFVGAVDGHIDPDRAERLYASACEHPWPRVGLQQTGLLRAAGWTLPADWRAIAEEQAAGVPSTARHWRLELLSVDETLGTSH